MRVKATGGTAKSDHDGQRSHGRNHATSPSVMARAASTSTPARFMPGAGTATAARVTTPEPMNSIPARRPSVRRRVGSVSDAWRSAAAAAGVAGASTGAPSVSSKVRGSIMRAGNLLPASVNRSSATASHSSVDSRSDSWSTRSSFPWNMAP